MTHCVHRKWYPTLPIPYISIKAGTDDTGELVINPVVGHHYFLPGPRLLYQQQSISTKLYHLMTQACMCIVYVY